MAPHWTLALLVTISVFLGIGRASITCETFGSYQCVPEDKCKPSFDYRKGVPACSNNLVCCAERHIQNNQPCDVGHKCVAANLCQKGVDYRSLGGRCYGNMICCKVEQPSVVSTYEPLEDVL